MDTWRFFCWKRWNTGQTCTLYIASEYRRKRENRRIATLQGLRPPILRDAWKKKGSEHIVLFQFFDNTFPRSSLYRGDKNEKGKRVFTNPWFFCTGHCIHYHGGSYGHTNVDNWQRGEVKMWRLKFKAENIISLGCLWNRIIYVFKEGVFYGVFICPIWS